MTQWTKAPGPQGWYWMRDKPKWRRRYSMEIVWTHGHEFLDYPEIRTHNGWESVSRYRRAEFCGPIEPPKDEVKS